MDRPNVTVVFQDVRPQPPMGCAEAGISLIVIAIMLTAVSGIGLWSLAGLLWGALVR